MDADPTADDHAPVNVNPIRSRNGIQPATGKRKVTSKPSIEVLESRELLAVESLPGVFNGGHFRIENSHASTFMLGQPGDQGVMGDWNGDGKETPGVFRNGTWYLDVQGNGYGAGDKVVQFGLPGDKAVVGDWNDDGKETPGVFRGGLWFLDRAGNGYDPSDDVPLQFGWQNPLSID